MDHKLTSTLVKKYDILWSKQKHWQKDIIFLKKMHNEEVELKYLGTHD